MRFRTLFTGQWHKHYEAVSSTNSALIELSREDSIPEGALITASGQTEGRGQRGNTWLSEPGKNLTLSLLFRPVFLTAERQFDINLAFSLAARDAIAEFLPKKNITVKWPNDIYIENKKVAGILIENSMHGQNLSTSVFGIGINVNQKDFGTLTKPTSVSLEANQDFNLEDVLEKICMHTEARYLQLRSGKQGELKILYEKHLYRKDEVTRFVAEDIPFSGIIKGVSENGALIIEEESGSKTYFHPKEIIFLD